MRLLLALAGIFACSCSVLPTPKTDVFTDLDAKIEEQLSGGEWHPASERLIRAQWAEYKKAHIQPNSHGDFHGAECGGGWECTSEIGNISEYAGAYNYKILANNTDSPGPHIQITVSSENRVFVLRDSGRVPAVVNNKIIFFTDGTLVKQNAQLGSKPYAQLEMTMIYLARHFGWVEGSPESFADDLSRLVKIK